jgi:DNA-directed RNA polymerase specialized sigma24 family protein
MRFTSIGLVVSRVLNWPASSQLRMSDAISPSEITQLLHAWQDGSREAFDRLVPLVHNELRVLAARRLSREWRHDRLQITAIVNETYLRLFDQREVDWQNRGHFFGIAAQLMRRVLLDHARRQTRKKRGGWPCRSNWTPRFPRLRTEPTPWTSSISIAR